MRYRRIMAKELTAARAALLLGVSVFALPSCFTAMWAVNRGHRSVSSADAKSAQAVSDAAPDDPWFCAQIDEDGVKLLDLQPGTGSWLWVHPTTNVGAVLEVLRHATEEVTPQTTLVVELTTTESAPRDPHQTAPSQTFSLSTVASAARELPGLEIAPSLITAHGACRFELHAEPRSGAHPLPLARATIQRTRVQPASFGSGSWIELPLVVAIDTGLVLLAIAAF